MNNIDIANGMIFQKMGVSKERFDDRLICQKKVYLLQSLGTNLGYQYNWYVHGPYSPALANYVFSNIDVLNSSDFSKFKLSAKADADTNTVNSLAEYKNGEMNIASWYELLASLLYIHRNRDSWKIQTQEQVIGCLRQYKPQFSETQCQDAIGILTSKGFLT